MQTKTMWLIVGVVAGLVLVGGAAGALLAAPDAPGEVAAPAGAAAPAALAADVAASINYQGRLTDPAGMLLDGTFPMRFQIYDDASAGSLVWDSGVVSVVVDRGLFSAVLAIDEDDFYGRGLWLRLYVNGEWLTPRQALLPVPYALSLRPGAEIMGEPDPAGSVLRVQMAGTHATRTALWGYTATGDGVRGTSAGGYGVAGYTEDGYAVRGSDHGMSQGRGYGGYFTSDNGIGVYGYSSASHYYSNIYAPGVYGVSATGVGVYGRSQGSGAGGRFASYSGNLIEGLAATNDADALHTMRFRVSNAGNVYADGTYTSPAADFAELLPARDGLEPGDVLVIGPDGQLARSEDAYSPAIVGVYSTRPGFLGGVAEDAGGAEVPAQQAPEPISADKEVTVELAAGGKVPLAIAGIVPVKASAENGAIVPGSLLVASATPGHCMHAGAEPQIGTVLGKALEGLDRGTGVILMLVTLQ